MKIINIIIQTERCLLERLHCDSVSAVLWIIGNSSDFSWISVRLSMMVMIPTFLTTR